jgi:hypothetical protein
MVLAPLLLWPVHIELHRYAVIFVDPDSEVLNDHCSLSFC